MFLSLPIVCKPKAFELLRKQLQLTDTCRSLVDGMFAIAMQVHTGDYRMNVHQVLDFHANAIQNRVKGSQLQAKLAHLHEYLFAELNFSSLHTDLSSPINYLLPYVLAKKCGSPIMVSLIYKVIAERLGFKVYGLNLDLHFLVKIELDDTTLYLDPADRGREVTLDEIKDMFSKNIEQGEEMLWSDDYLAPVTHHGWWTRVMQELISIMNKTERYEMVAAMLEMEFLLWPEIYRLKRDLGLVYTRLGKREPAIAFLVQYLEHEPDDPQVSVLKGLVKTLRS